MDDGPMDKRNPPESFGVFKPVGHVVMAFEPGDHRDAAHRALQDAGFADDALIDFSAEEMARRTRLEMDQASGTAAFGYEIVLAKEHLKLAERGCPWLVVHAPSDELTAKVERVAREHDAVVADRYGRLIVEKLLQPPPNS